MSDKRAPDDLADDAKKKLKVEEVCTIGYNDYGMSL